MTKTTKTKKVIDHSDHPFQEAWHQAPEHFWKIDFGKFSLGLFLLIIGILYLAQNLGWLPIVMQFDLWQLWPMLLIFLGLSLISGRGWVPILAGSILTITVLIIVTIIITDRMTLTYEPEITQLTTDNLCREPIIKP